MSFGPSLRCPQPRRIRLLKSICSLKTPLPSISAKQGGVNGELARVRGARVRGCAGC
ncbi:hypothetical protein V6Z12_A07G109300 [Gossypium hirsutum]